jgi:hypothetical protein
MQASTKIMELRISIQKSGVGSELKSDWCSLCTELSNLFT